MADIASAGEWLFTDGGVIGRNPSKIGGTWAWVRVSNGVEVERRSGVLLPSDIECDVVTNNNTELHALCRGILALPDGWKGTIASDSAIALGWVFQGWKTDLIPPKLLKAMRCAHCRRIGATTMRLGGHPTKSDLEAGVRLSKEPNYPVSAWNVLCDSLCNEESAKYRKLAESR